MKEISVEKIALAETGDTDDLDVIQNSYDRLESLSGVKLDMSVEKAQTSKRKRLHLGSEACSDLVNTEEGAMPLSNPHMASQNAANKDVNRGLHPVIRNKRRKTESFQDRVAANEESDCDKQNVFQLNSFQSSQGFVSASKMYDIKHEHRPQISNRFTENPDSSFKKSHSINKGKQIKQIANQGSLRGFVSSSTPTGSTDHSCKVVKQNTVNESKPTSSSTVMYSPIKKLSATDSKSCIYISDDSPSCSPSLSQENSQKSSISDNAVVKQLFEAAKHFDPKSKPKGKKTKPVSSPFLKTFKNEGAKYFDSDSFDMNTAFDSDMEDNASNDSIISSTGKKVGNVGSDKYGLLGTGSYPKEEKVNYFERLPPEVLENIFCQLPLLDLCLNSNRVCLQWNSIIADEKFVPWKKLYHKLKSDEGSSREFIQNTMHKHGMNQPALYLSSLIRYMKNFKPITASDMLQCLQKHNKYSWAKDLIDERLQDCKTHEEPNPWSVITILVIVAHNVYEVQEIIRCLSVSSSQCTSKEIIECLYCIATFLYAFKLAKPCDVWNGMHYRLFYALYLFENASSSSCADLHSVMSENKGGQQSLVKYSSGTDSVKLTHEQLRIVKHLAGPHEIIKIVAFAGTGKTTTLVRYTQLRPDKKFLLVVYNKSVCDYAKTKFPRNVECRTGHSLAFQTFGRRYAHKLFQLKVYTLTQTLKARKGENLFLQAKFTMTTIENFLASDDTDIDIHHVPDTRFNEKTGIKENIDLPSKRLYVTDARFIWQKMQDPREKKIGMSHDGYLKLYQLSQPSLRGYDCILIDEAQDLTPAITDILLHQRQGKILVGDPHQQIYSFRGAVNAMNRINADTIFYLTQSFRFGPEIAQVAMSCLEVLKKEKKKTLVGSGKKSCVTGEKVGQLAIISRCNFTVFSEAVKKCCYSDEECKVAFVGGTSNFGFPMLMDMYALTLSEHERQKEGLEIQNKLIKMFKSFRDLDNFATKSMDNELLGKIKIVKTYNHNLPLHIRKIESKSVRDARQADYVFSTAHKSKGLEFSTVRVTDDFLGDATRGILVLGAPQVHLDEEGDELDGLMGGGVMGAMVLNVRMLNNDAEKKDDEENLLYVAVTRAKNALQMSPTLMSVLKRAGEDFQFPVYSNDLRESGRTFKCIKTDAEFQPNCLTLEKKTVVLGDSQQRTGGLYSPAFLTEDFHSFAALLGLTSKELLEEKKKENSSVDPAVFYPHGFDAAGD
ncbi:F-box DNA helicase 1-like [Mercenaria mercenaria]|uniref:F-box DNA helicase 1-like n=1 Tax=Mercenaria mercenaria TaxID=6596 RepID=UPI00234F2EAD|nr:F-box DNA helicase 1-like [Mercenaria mercenaria]